MKLSKYFKVISLFSILLIHLHPTNAAAFPPKTTALSDAKKITINDIIKIHEQQISRITPSPDGLYAVVEMGNTDNPYSEYTSDIKRRTLWLVRIADGYFKQLTDREIDGHNSSWSPDGERIAFLSRESGKTEIRIMNRDGSNRVQVTNTESPAKNPFDRSELYWTVDGKNIIYTLLPNGSKYKLAEIQRKKIEGFAGNYKGISVYGPDFQKKLMVAWQDPSGFTSELWKFNVSKREASRLAKSTSHPLRIHPSFSKDGNRFLVSEGPVLLEYSLHNGKMEKIYNGPAALSCRTGDQILLVRRKEKQIEVGRLTQGKFVVKSCHQIPGFGWRIHSWSKDGSKIYATTNKGISNYLVQVDLHNGKTTYLTKDKMNVSNYLNRARAAALPDGSVMFPYEGPNQPVEVWMRTAKGAMRQVTRFNEFLTHKDIPGVKLITYKSDGWDIEAFLVLPPKTDSTRPLPTLAYMHGGPEACVTASFSQIISARSQSAAFWLAAHGYAVFIPNYRGSDNYGIDFMNQLQNYNITSTPHRDLMAGLDDLVKKGIADPQALGIYGHSWGGNQVTWAITHTGRFKGALAAVGGGYDMLSEARVSGMSFLSMAPNRQGNADPYAMWNNPEAYKKFSPIEHVKNAKTPTLFIETGAGHKEGNLAAAFFNGLVYNGLETYFVYYPEASHTGGWNNRYKRDYLKRVLAWFDHCLQGKPLPRWFSKSSN